jgi:hypothetical protein
MIHLATKYSQTSGIVMPFIAVAHGAIAWMARGVASDVMPR